MNALAVELVAVAKDYLGPAAPAFLQREMVALGVNSNTVTSAHVLALAERARVAATKVMDAKRAALLAQALAEHAGRAEKPKGTGEHRLAMDAAAKLLASGRVRQAEAAYRELVRKHADVDSYAGLARALVALADPASALTVLRDGAAALAKRSDRVGAVALLGVAVDLAPADLNAHRRLAAALANQGDLLGACAEYARYIDVVLAQRDTRRAWLELTYGRETLGDLPQLLQIADRVAAAQSGAMPTPPPSPRVAATPSAPTATPSPVRPVTIKPSPLPPTPPARPTTIGASEVGVKPASALAAVMQARTRPAATNAVVLKNAATITHVEKADMATPAELLARAGIAAPPKPEASKDKSARAPVDVEAELSRLTQLGDATQQAMTADARAGVLIAARDARAVEQALDAARRFIALHKLQAASDVLLGLIAAGFKDREAQRLLIEVDCEIGARDVAREKCRLLGAVYRLDGQGAIAEDVERLAMIL